MRRSAIAHLVRLLSTVVAATLVAGLLTGFGTGSSQATPGGPGAGPSAASGSGTTSSARTRAEKALSRATKLLTRSSSAHSSGAPATRKGRDATLVLRDLSLRRGDLSAGDRRRAASLLARPATNAQAANAAVIVHYVAGKVDPAYAQKVLDTVTHVRETYLGAGYRAPLSDGTAGGDARFDVYLSDIGKTGAYGYCTSDQPTAAGSDRYDRWAFCVLDDDFTDFPGDPTQLLQVTTAHEYFHAVQYAYDSLEDGWFMEGTAAWAEDQVYDDVNDNMQYARFSPLAGPRFSLDIFEANGFRQYGSWLFFRWLSEQFPTAQGDMPVIVRQFWEAADSSQGGATTNYSLRAISQVLKQLGTPLPQAFARFADANRRPEAFYSEAAANTYPTAPLAQKIMLSPTRRTASARAVKLNHLSSATTRFVPKRLQGKQVRLRIQIDMASKSDGSVAIVSTYFRSGKVKTRLVKLDGRGNGRYVTRFSNRKVRGVEVTLVNASTRYTQCYQESPMFSCFGTPVDQDRVQRVRATVVR